MNQITKSMKKLILIQIFFTFGLSAFSQVYRNPSKIEAPGYDSLLNKSRTISGSNPVERKAELDSYCKERCIRLIEILIKNPKYIVIEDGMEKEAHLYSRYSENVDLSMSPAGRINSDSVSQLENSRFDSSPGHHRNRIKPNVKNFGQYSMNLILMIPNPDYDPNLISNKYIKVEALITYEAFK